MFGRIGRIFVSDYSCTKHRVGSGAHGVSWDLDIGTIIGCLGASMMETDARTTYSSRLTTNNVCFIVGLVKHVL